MEKTEQTKPKSESGTHPKPKPKLRTPKLKIFQLIQKNFAIVGIDPNLVTQPYPVNSKILLGFLILTASVICNLMYTLREATTYAEYSHSIYMFSFAVAIFVALVIILLNAKKLFSFINDCESLLNSGE